MKRQRNRLLRFVKKRFPGFYYRHEYPLQEISDRQVAEKPSTTIPNDVYQTWETRTVRRTHAAEIQKFRELNPEMNFYLFDREDRDRYMCENWAKHEILEIYQRSRFKPMQADIFRYAILFQRGGYYFDINKACARPLLSLHGHDATAFITNEPRPPLFLPPDRTIRHAPFLVFQNTMNRSK